MDVRNRAFGALTGLAVALAGVSPAAGKNVTLLERPPDPHGAPRPARDSHDVPLRTSLYLELAMSPDAVADEVDPESVSVSLRPEGGELIEVLRPGRRFAEGVTGWLRSKGDLQGNAALAVYVEPGRTLRPGTIHAVHVTARSRSGAGMSGGGARWSFTTESPPADHVVTFPLDLKKEPVRWRGAFFSGVCNILFCSQAASFGPTYDLMIEARKQHPRAWSYQRDFWMTGTEFTKPGFVPQNLPNIVRERETRRIASIEPREKGMLLRVEDVFGHEQYGIPGGRPLGEDYQVGNEVLIADGVHNASARVLAIGDPAGTVLVTPLQTPPGGWKIAYDGPLPTREDPDAPGLFPPGGCYLRNLKPHGTPCYYWGRLDKEWDLEHRRGGRRLMVNFADAPGDLARDGRSWTTAKDLAEWHDVARTITGHLIDRYGADALTFTWSVFNEPDLGPLFWRADWDDLQRFYDYAVDGILRAFEDRGLDSQKVFVGGLELGGIFGIHLKLNEFLAHCSPRAAAKGALPLNAAVADRRLDGKRSRRVETLCQAHGGKGSPCDFVSIHSYDRSELMAAKLIRAKEVALEIDPEFYRDLWVNSHESCPDWMPPPDEAAADSYLGNGYFPTWCVDVTARQLRQAARDPRFGFGETILTVWPPPANFSGMNAVTRILHHDDDGRRDQTMTIPMPVFHVLGMLSDMGDRYWTLPEQHIGGHIISGFASRDEKAIRVVLYAHHAQDTQSRSEAAFDVALEIAGTGKTAAARVSEYRFDKDHNSYFHRGRALRDRPAAIGQVAPERLAALTQALGSQDPTAQRAALDALKARGPAAQPALTAILKLAEATPDVATREAARAAMTAIFTVPAFTRAEAEEIRKLAECHPTGTASVQSGPDGRLRIKARVAGNGLNILVLEPETPR